MSFYPGEAPCASEQRVAGRWLLWPVCWGSPPSQWGSGGAALSSHLWGALESLERCTAGRTEASIKAMRIN